MHRMRHTARMHSIVLLPGLACDAGLWHTQLPALATRHRVHLSDVHAREDTLPAMADQLLRTLRRPALARGDGAEARRAVRRRRFRGAAGEEQLRRFGHYCRHRFL